MNRAEKRQQTATSTAPARRAHESLPRRMIGSACERGGNDQNGGERRCGRQRVARLHRPGSRGQGDRAEAPDNTSTYTTKVKQQLKKGKAIAEGTAPSNTPVKGVSVIDIQGEIDAASGNAADALSNQKVPRNIEKHIRGYFDQINKGGQ